MVGKITIILCALAVLVIAALAANNGGVALHRRDASRPKPAAGGGTPAFVDWTNGVPLGAASGSTTQFRQTNNVASGNSVVVYIQWEDANATWSASDTSGNTYTSMQKTNSGGLVWGQVFRAINVTGGSPLIIVATNNSATGSGFIKGSMIEYSGVTALDVQFLAGTNGASEFFCVTGTAATANAVEVFYAFSGNYDGRVLIQSNINWSVGYNVGGSSMQHWTSASSGTYGATVTNDNTSQTILLGGALK